MASRIQEKHSKEKKAKQAKERSTSAQSVKEKADKDLADRKRANQERAEKRKSTNAKNGEKGAQFKKPADYKGKAVATTSQGKEVAIRKGTEVAIRKGTEVAKTTGKVPSVTIEGKAVEISSKTPAASRDLVTQKIASKAGVSATRIPWRMVARVAGRASGVVGLGMLAYEVVDALGGVEEKKPQSNQKNRDKANANRSEGSTESKGPSKVPRRPAELSKSKKPATETKAKADPEKPTRVPRRPTEESAAPAAPAAVATEAAPRTVDEPTNENRQVEWFGIKGELEPHDKMPGNEYKKGGLVKGKSKGGRQCL